MRIFKVDYCGYYFESRIDPRSELGLSSIIPFVQYKWEKARLFKHSKECMLFCAILRSSVTDFGTHVTRPDKGLFFLPLQGREQERPWERGWDSIDLNYLLIRPVMFNAWCLSDLSLQGAKLIITVMFSAIKYGDVSKQQLVSGARNLNSPATLLPKTFLKENFIKINSTNLQDFTRDKVQKLKIFAFVTRHA